MLRNSIVTAIRLAVVLTLPACIGCSQLRPSSKTTEPSARISNEALRGRLEQVENSFEVNIRQATDDLLNGQPSRRTQRLCLLWKMQLLPVARVASDQPDSLRGMLDFWALCVRMEQYLTAGEGRELFGEQQGVATAAAKRCTDEIESLVREVVPASQFAQADRDVDDLASRFPIRGEFRTEIVRIASEKPSDLTFSLKQVLDITLAPLDALKGVDRTAAAIREFTAVAARLTDVVRDLPEDTRMQTQLLALDLEQIETLQAATKSLQAASESVTRIAETAETMPQTLRIELETALDSLDKRQGEIQTTLTEARASLKQLDESAKTIQVTADRTAKAGDAWTGTFRALQEMVASFRTHGAERDNAASMPVESTSASNVTKTTTAPTGGDSPSSHAAARPFDINDYTRTAEALEAAAKQIRELTHEVRDLSSSSELADALRSLGERGDLFITSTGTTASGTVDHLAWRLIQVALLVFVLMLIYRFAAMRWITARQSGA